MSQLAGLNCADQILSEVSAQTPCSVMYHETPSEANIPLEEISVVPLLLKFTVNDYRVSDGDSQVTENVQPSRQSPAFHQNGGATSVEPTVTAGTSQCE